MEKTYHIIYTSKCYSAAPNSNIFRASQNVEEPELKNKHLRYLLFIANLAKLQ